MSEIVRNRCAGCNATFDKGETRYYSIAYGSHDDTQLCKSCWEYEREEEEKAGTNYLPHLVRKYNKQ